jgi:RNA polymerase sigma-70 factor (ECF subfamily)
LLVHRLGDKNTVEDLLQDVFLKALRQDAHFCDIKAPRTGLFPVARTTLIDHARLSSSLHEAASVRHEYQQ